MHFLLPVVQEKSDGRLSTGYSTGVKRSDPVGVDSGRFFRLTDENGKNCQENCIFKHKFRKDPMKILMEHCKFDPLQNHDIFRATEDKIKSIQYEP